MISKLDILIKCITLFYREKLLNTNEKDKNLDNSNDIIKTVLSIFKEDKKPLAGGDAVIIRDLHNLLLDIMNKPEDYDKDVLLQTLNVVLKDKENVYKILEKNINTELSKDDLKSSILSTRRFLNNYYKDVKIMETINNISFKISTGKVTSSMQELADDLINQLETLRASSKNSSDPGVIDVMDLTDESSVEEAINKVQELSANKGKFITGWKNINKMVNGGFRRGEQWVVSALQHNYKSGFIQSLFVQFCTLNKPVLKDPDKKPLILLISFEDDMNIIAEFMYRYMYYNEFKEIPQMRDITSKEISKYIISKLSVNGFHAKIIRVDPSEWSYKNIFNKVLELEADGYEVQALIIDYLSKLPTTYCDRSGPAGTDVRDLFNRLRNFCSAKNILNITPHQISTEALQMFRSGVTGFDFIEEVRSKNYYSESKQIPQVVDGEIYIIKGKVGSDWFLYLGKGKHRTPIITPDEDKNVVLAFPKKAPIPEDLDSEDIELNNNTNEFDF